MTHNLVTVNGISVASTASQPTHINIHFHQESAVSELLKAGGSLKRSLSRPRDPGLPEARINNEQLAVGVTQLLLGIVSCALGASIYVGPWMELRALGCAFWAGFVAIVAEAGTIVHEKHRGRYSGPVSGLLTLAVIATAVAAAVLCVRSLIWQTDDSTYMKIISVCDVPDPVTTTPASRWMGRRRDSDWRMEACRSLMTKMMVRNLFLAFCVLLTVVCILKVIVALASLGLCLRSKCVQNSQPPDEESDKKLLGVSPTHPSTSKEETLTIINL
ncbi:transmembrane protein 176B [Ctenodactylus gundi]